MKKIYIICAICVASLSTNAQTASVQDFERTGTHGEELSLKDLLLDGNMVVLDFFATYCPPCNASVPALQNLWEEKNKGEDSLWIIGISTNSIDDDSLNSWASEFPADYPKISNAGDIYSFYNEQYGSGGIPLFLMIIPCDSNGDPVTEDTYQYAEVAWTQVGWGGSTINALNSEIANSMACVEAAKDAAGGVGPGEEEEEEEEGNPDKWTVGIDDEESSSIEMYPNPANDLLNIEMASASDFQVQISDLLGKVVLTEVVVSNSRTSLDVSSLPKGLYMVKVSTDTDSHLERVIVK